MTRTADIPEGLIDDAVVAEAEALVGGPYRITRWNTQATPDAISHYSLAIGDLNPLWTDVEHGARSCHGTNLAPPTFLYSVYDAEVMPGLGQLMALHTGSRWRFHDVVRVGDHLDAEARLARSGLVRGRDGRRRIEQVGATTYFRVAADGSREEIAEVEQRILRIPPRGSGPDELSFEMRPVHRYSPEDLDAIQRDVLAAEVRGAERRTWDGVRVGDSLGQVVKGPYTRMTMICYYAGAIGSAGYRAFDAWWHNRWHALHDPDRLPTDTFDPAYFAGAGVTSMGHHDAATADRLGMPGLYDNGNQRVGIVATLVTNWMGDDAWLRELGVQVRRPVIEGDTLWITGQVVDKRRTGDGSAVVEATIEAVNQVGETVTTGSCVVELPA